MKQSNWLDDFTEMYRKLFKEAEERGAARERERYFATIGTIAGELKKLTDRMTALMLKMEAKSEAAGPRPQPKKRKVVVASEESLDEMRKAMTALHESTQGRGVFKPLQVNKALGISTILAGRYMGILTNRGILEKVGAKGYRLAQRKENGLDEAVQTRTPAE